MFTNDMILNGSGIGPVGEVLEHVRYEPGLLQPYFQTDPRSPRRGQRCVTIATNRCRFDEKLKREVPVLKEYRIRDLQANGVNSPVFNAVTTLRKEEWIELDRRIVRAARYRLRAWSDLAAANSFGGFNAMGKMILEHESMSDPGEALVDMEGLREGRTDQPRFQLQGVPLPITHSDFWFSERYLAASRNTGTPLSSTMGEASGRRVGEAIEKTTIGNQTGVIYGGASGVGGYGYTSQVYGYVNFTNRNTKTGLYKPTGNGRSGTGWVPADTVKDVLACLDTLRANKFYGPFHIYHSNDWDQYLDNDYFLTSTATNTPISTVTLRQRLEAIRGIQGCDRLDFLFSSLTDGSHGGPGLENVASAYAFTMILVQMTSEVAEAINGQDITTIQWPSVGGMRTNFKVFCIQVPRLRSDFYGNCGILQATFNT